MAQILSKEDFLHWLKQVMEQHRLVAPARAGELLLFRPVSRPEDIVLGSDNTALPPKDCLFPASEVLFNISREGEEIELLPTLVDGDTVLLGIRPCDALGLAVIDKPFLQEPADELYRQHRERTTMVGLACLSACSECFCTSMGTKPNDASNVDILLTEVPNGYLVETSTPKGNSLLPRSLLKDVETKTPAPPTPSLVQSDAITPEMRRNFDSSYWDRLADRCIHCNVCAYVCPTCYCFDIRDLPDNGRMARVRTWESCQSKGFSRIAGGHDPRASKGIRLRQRFAHKLIYMPGEFGALGCVGCGRCVRACPVNIDIREIMADIQGIGDEAHG